VSPDRIKAVVLDASGVAEAEDCVQREVEAAQATASAAASSKRQLRRLLQTSGTLSIGFIILPLAPKSLGPSSLQGIASLSVSTSYKRRNHVATISRRASLEGVFSELLFRASVVRLPRQVSAVRAHLSDSDVSLDPGSSYSSEVLGLQALGRQGVCGNGLCEAGESSLGGDSCPEDCPEGPSLRCPEDAEGRACSSRGVCVAVVGACECNRGFSGASCSSCSVGYVAQGPNCVPEAVVLLASGSAASPRVIVNFSDLPLWIVALTASVGVLVVALALGAAFVLIRRKNRRASLRDRRFLGLGGARAPSSEEDKRATASEEGSSLPCSTRKCFNAIFVHPPLDDGAPIASSASGSSATASSVRSARAQVGGGGGGAGGGGGGGSDVSIGGARERQARLDAALEAKAKAKAEEVVVVVSEHKKLQSFCLSDNPLARLSHACDGSKGSGLGAGTDEPPSPCSSSEELGLSACYSAPASPNVPVGAEKLEDASDHCLQQSSAPSTPHHESGCDLTASMIMAASTPKVAIRDLPDEAPELMRTATQIPADDEEVAQMFWSIHSQEVGVVAPPPATATTTATDSLESSSDVQLCRSGEFSLDLYSGEDDVPWPKGFSRR